ncbi:protein kinase domain-containing protein [Tahibacter soli]|uniref:Serine/threonine-protein kinase n=1 Tax=Tahibacter soli TaxID=2983605 RepID=A0A9X3YPT2_9GAMM|nr:serine/threonine-protein kinase [Tahibacter soli]MDC8016252.1 serine/threonine-protein kinase [Tahibacter soli]
MRIVHLSLRDYFEAALALPAADRAAFLRERCDDPSTRRRVEAMLAAHDGEGLLNLPVEALADRLAAAPAMDPADWTGRTVGGVRLLGAIGQGGSAVVFRGERLLQDVPQTVAVKLLRHVLLTEFDVRRFRRERAAMARLTHPHIARLFDGGTTDAGLAYLVLEYVDGERITDYATREGLGSGPRIALMIDVCRAVEAAHRALIVHRDLKPSNVFVTREGHVKLLDFGIAKFLNADEDATVTGHGALTPAYAAPEQFHGEAVTTATDVYALGVLLAELATGRRPGDVRASDADDTRPLPRRLQGDLANVVRMATASDPQRRYASAGSLADDLERFLESRPVRAHPPSRRYRLGKFYARHRPAIGVAAVFLALLLVAVAAALWQADAATAHAARARAEAAQARATRDFMIDVFRLAEPAGARAAPPSVVDVTEAALSRIADDRRMDSRARLELETRLGAVLRGQGRLEGSREVLRAAAARGEAAFGADDALVADARLELIEASIAAGDYAAADAEVEALGLHARLDRDRTVRRALLAATVAARRGDAAKATRLIGDAEALCADCADPLRFELLIAKGDVYGTFDRNAVAAASFEAGAALAATLYGPVHTKRASALDGLSSAYRRMGRADDALRIAREVLDIDDRVGTPALHWRRAVHLHRLANAYHDLGRFDEALDAFERSLAVSKQVSDDNDQSLAVDIRNVGIVYYKLGRFDRAIAHLNDALARFVAFSGPHHRSVADLRANIADILATGGDTAKALPMVDAAIADLRQAGAGAERPLAEAWLHQGSIRLIAGDPAGALVSIEQATALLDAPAAETREATRLHARVLHGVALARLRRAQAARAQLTPALERLAALDANHHGQAYARFALGALALAEGHCEAARENLEAGRALLRRKPFVYAHLRAAEADLASDLPRRCAP